jgi:hypothetical protein
LIYKALTPLTKDTFAPPRARFCAPTGIRSWEAPADPCDLIAPANRLEKAKAATRQIILIQDEFLIIISPE